MTFTLFSFPCGSCLPSGAKPGTVAAGGIVYADSGQQLVTSSSRDLRHFKDTVGKRALARADPPPTGRRGVVFLCQASGQQWRSLGPSRCFLYHLGWPHSEETDAFTAPLSWTNFTIQQHWVKPEILTLSADEKCTSRWVYIPWMKPINDKVSFYRVSGTRNWENICICSHFQTLLIIPMWMTSWHCLMQLRSKSEYVCFSG